MKHRPQSMTDHHDRDGVPSKRLKIPLSPLPSRQHSVSVSKVRKKTLEACQKCREKRIKCNGEWPCESCSNKGFECSLRPGLHDDQVSLTEVMDQVLYRLRRVEDIIHQQNKDAPSERREGRHSLVTNKRTVSSVTEFNRQTGCFEYYGETSNFVVASSLGKRLNRLIEDDDDDDDADDGNPSSSSSRQKEPQQQGSQVTQERGGSSIDIPGLQTFIDAYDYVMPLNTPIRRYRCLQPEVADRHLDTFFATIHTYFPIFDVPAFRARYARLRELFGSNLLYAASGGERSPGQQQSLCLLYAVLALGALYDDNEDSSSWAAWYFSEAQELLGRLFDAVNLQLVQAGMFMGAYAQHALKPNLAYNLAGTATRMAFSIGLNLDPTLASHDWDAEEGRRTWWMLFIQEVELSLDSGRPMSIRKSDISIEYPTSGNPAPSDEPPPPYQVTDFIRHLAGVAQITRDILKFVATSGSSISTEPSWEAKLHSLDQRLSQWRAELPPPLKFDFEAGSIDRDLAMPNSRVSRQRSSLLVHHSLALIVLHRFSLTKPDMSPTEELTTRSQSRCLKAAEHIILHIHSLFQVAPNLRRWRYYCYYCLQATLVLLIKVIDEPLAEQTKDIVAKCHLSIAVFKQIDLKVAQRCADLVARVLLNSGRRRQPKKNGNGRSASSSTTTGKQSQKGVAPSLKSNTTSKSSSTQPALADHNNLMEPPPLPQSLDSTVPVFESSASAQQTSDQAGPAPGPAKELPQCGASGLFESSSSSTDDLMASTGTGSGSCPDLTFSGTEWDFSVVDDDELWNDFVDSGMHVRPFESWMNILNDQAE